MSFFSEYCDWVEEQKEEAMVNSTSVEYRELKATVRRRYRKRILDDAKQNENILTGAIAIPTIAMILYSLYNVISSCTSGSFNPSDVLLKGLGPIVLAPFVGLVSCCLGETFCRLKSERLAKKLKERWVWSVAPLLLINTLNLLML